jgi:uncharacterized protein
MGCSTGCARCQEAGQVARQERIGPLNGLKASKFKRRARPSAAFSISLDRGNSLSPRAADFAKQKTGTGLSLRQQDTHQAERTPVQIFLPIADLPVNIFLILAMGMAVGFVSGMFGIGGGFLLTPLLIFIGITPAVAVASVAGHIAASSFSGALSYWRRRAIDPALAFVLLIGGTIGTMSGVWLFTLLRAYGQLDLTIALSYVVLLSGVGGAMLWESVGAIIRARRGQQPTLRRPGAHNWVHGLPLKLRFKKSKIYLSIFPVIAIGIFIGFVGAILGIGGGFILVPLLIYVLRVPTGTVIGTSQVLTLVTMAFATILHATTNHLVDAVLALILMVGGVIGAQFGARAGQRISSEQLRLLLGLLILAVGIRFAVELTIRPEELFTIRALEPGP